MAKRNSKANAPKENKNVTEKGTANSPLMGSLGRFFGFFVPGMGFGGAFIFVSVTILAIFFWANRNGYLGNKPKWEIVFNRPENVWGSCDVLQEVKNSNPELLDHSFDDPALLEDVSNSFKVINIVKNIKSAIRRYPNQVILDIEYCTPVAMVWVNSESRSGYYPVDKDGIVLPTQYFTGTDVSRYITIRGIVSTPTNPAGQKWNDDRVNIAARIAGQIMPYKDELGFVNIKVHEHIVPSGNKTETFNGKGMPDEYDTQILFDVELKNGTLIRWTTAILKKSGDIEAQEEMPLEEKITLLRNRLQTKGTIKPDSPGEILSFKQETEKNKK